MPLGSLELGSEEQHLEEKTAFPSGTSGCPGLSSPVSLDTHKVMSKFGFLTSPGSRAPSEAPEVTEQRTSKDKNTLVFPLWGPIPLELFRCQSSFYWMETTKPDLVNKRGGRTEKKAPGVSRKLN